MDPRAGQSLPVRPRVFVFETHELTLQGLRELLEREGFEIAGFSGALLESFSAIVGLRPDVCLLDLGTLDDRGIRLCRAVHAIAPGIPCVMLATLDDAESVAASLAAGAKDFVLKTLRGNALVEALRAAARPGQTL
ncbi:MAG TPA: response regulator [Sinomonas sp.]|nr:response regulator [Sinomonas sp.]